MPNFNFFDNEQPTPIQEIRYQKRHNLPISFSVKRDDLVDKLISGNKWRKLKHNILQFNPNQYVGIATFGGAYSNHIAALAAAGAKAKINTLGFIRTHHIDLSNPTIQFARSKGMKLVAISRQDYAQRRTAEFQLNLQKQYPNLLWIPEGGTNNLAFKGLAELATQINQQGSFDIISCAIGTGGTIRGLMQALPDKQFVGVAAVKDDSILSKLAKEFGQRLTIVTNYLFGGYGKTNDNLNQFCLDFYHQTKVPIEPIYTGKLMYAWTHEKSLIDIASTNSVLIIHTGGLQGLKGLSYRHPSLLPLLKVLTSESDV